ncbi:MAG: hypothetical protein ACOC3I_08615 [Verrucomicrobiota bacterium]
MAHPNGTFYFLLHLLGILLVFSAYGLPIARGLLGSESAALRKFGATASGVGLVSILVSGFGMIERIGYSYTSTWVLIKILAWLLLGGLIALINRKPAMGQIWYWTTLVLGLIAVWAVYYKPGM